MSDRINTDAALTAPESAEPYLDEQFRATAADNSIAPLHDARRFDIGSAHVVIGLVVLAVAVRVIGLGLRPLWLDEGYSLYAIERTWHDLWTIVPSYETHPPFYYSILKLWSALSGSSPVALRGFSVLFSVATVPVAIAAALELERQDRTGRPILLAGIAGLLTACSPMLVYLDQQARPYALMVFAYAVATLGLLRLLREFRSGTAGTRLSWAILAGGTALTLWSHNLGILYAFCLAVALIPAWLEQPLAPGRLKRGIAAAAIILLLYLPCVAITARQVGGWGTSWLAWEPYKLLALLGFYSIPIESVNIGSAVAALIMLLLAKRAIQHAVSEAGWTPQRALLLLWCGPTLLAIAISALYIPIYLPRTLAATLVPFYVALGAAAARTATGRERLLIAALAITLIPTAAQTAVQPAPEKWDKVGAYLQRVVAPTDEVWIYPNDSILPLRETIHGTAYRIRELPGPFPALAFKGVNRSGSPSTPSLTADQAGRIASDPRLRTIPTIWLVMRQYWIFDPHSDLPRALMQHRRPGKPQRWGYIVVQPFYASAQAS